MRVFTQIRQYALQKMDQQIRFEKIERSIDSLRNEMEEILRDQNDINEDVSIQLDAINDALAEIMSEKIQMDKKCQRPRIGFMQDE